jgi:predicted ferric reductase
MVVVTAAIYLHSPSRELLASPLVYLLAALCLQILIGVLRFAQVLYRNVRFKKPLCRAVVRPVTFKRDYEDEILISDAVHVHVRLSRPWKHRAGQYAYVCIPGVSYLSFAQQHPFYVSWSYKDGGSDYVVFLVQKRRGFTKDLFQHIGNSPGNTFPMRAVIEGPYGKGLNLDSYGTVLLFATGIGIAGQLSYVTQLLEGYCNCEVKTRRIALFWEVESECKRSKPALDGLANG